MVTLLSKPTVGTLSQEDYNTQMSAFREQRAERAPQDYYDDLKRRTAGVSSRKKFAPRSLSRGGIGKRISLGNEKRLQRIAEKKANLEGINLFAEHEAGLSKIQDKERSDFETSAVSQFKAKDYRTRYSEGDPNIQLVAAYQHQRFLVDTGERFNGKSVYRSQGGEKFVGLPTISDVYGFGGGQLWGDKIINNKIVRLGHKGWEATSIQIGDYSPTSNVEVKVEPWKYSEKYIPSTQNKYASKVEAAGKGKARAEIVSKHYDMNKSDIYQYDPFKSRDPSVNARRNILQSGGSPPTFKEIQATPSLLQTTPRDKLPVIDYWGGKKIRETPSKSKDPSRLHKEMGNVIVYGETGKVYAGGMNFPFATGTPSFKERTGFTELQAAKGIISLKLGEGQYDPGEIANAFITGVPGETLVESAARVRGEKIITQKASVPVKLGAAPFAVESYSPTVTVMGGESRRPQSDLEFVTDIFQGRRPVSDLTKPTALSDYLVGSAPTLISKSKKTSVMQVSKFSPAEEFAMKYGEPTAGDVITQLRKESKDDLKDVGRVRELVFGTEGLALEKKKAGIKGLSLPKELRGGFGTEQDVRERQEEIRKLELGFYTQMGKDFTEFESKISTPERDIRVKELEKLRKQIDTQIRKKIDGKSISDFSTQLKSNQKETIKAGETYSNFLEGLGKKEPSLNDLKKAEDLYDKAKFASNKYNVMVSKYVSSTNLVNKNIEKLKDYDDIAREQKLKYGTERKIIERWEETRDYLIENEPKLIDAKITTTLQKTGNIRGDARINKINKGIAAWNIGMDQINTIPKAAYWKPEVRKYQRKLGEYEELTSTLKMIERGPGKGVLSKSASDKLYFLSIGSGIPSGYEVAEGLLGESGKRTEKLNKYLFSAEGGVLKRLTAGAGRASMGVGVLFGLVTKKRKGEIIKKARELEEFSLFFKPSEAEMKTGFIDTQKALLSQTRWAKQARGKTYAYMEDIGMTPTEYTDFAFTPAKGVKAKASKAFKMSVGDPGVLAVGSIAFLPAIAWTYGIKSLPFLLTAAQTPVGEVASDLTRGVATVGGEQLGVEGVKGYERITGKKVSPKKAEVIERSMGAFGNVGSFAIPGRYQAALMGLSVKEVKKAPVQTAVLVGTGALFKGAQAYGSAWKWGKLTSPAYGKMLQEPPLARIGKYAVGKSDMYRIGLTAPGYAVMGGLGGLYLTNIATRSFKTQTKTESRKLGKDIEKEFALLGLGGQFISSVRPVGKWEAEGQWKSELFKLGPDSAGPFRGMFGRGKTVESYAKKMKMVEEPKTYDDQFLQVLGLQKPKIKPEAKQWMDLFVNEGYIKPRPIGTSGLARTKDVYRPTVVKIMGKYGKDVHLQGSKVGGEQIPGFRKTAKSDYDLVFTGPKSKYLGFRDELAKAMVKKDSDLSASFGKTGKLFMRTQKGRDVINLQQSKVKVGDKDIFVRDGIRMLKADKWIKDKYSIVKALEKKKVLTKVESAKLKKAKIDIGSYEGREFITTSKGLETFETRLTQFQDLYATTKHGSLEAKYKIKPEEIEVFEKDTGPWDVIREGTKIFNAKLGGSAVRLHYQSTKVRAAEGVPKPKDLDLYVKDIRNYKRFLTKGLIKKGYKQVLTGEKITSQKQFKIEKSETGFDIRLKDGGVQVHSESMLMQNLFSVGPATPFKPLFKKTPEGYKIPRYELQARRELYGAFADTRASKDLPKFITGQRALALEGKEMTRTRPKDLLSQFMTSKKTAGRATPYKRKTPLPGWDKFGKDFQRLNMGMLPQTKATIKMNLAQRKELSKLPEIMKLVKGEGLPKTKTMKVKTGKGLFSYKTVSVLQDPIKGKPSDVMLSKSSLLEGYKEGYEEFGYKPYSLYGIVPKGYGYAKKYGKYPTYPTYKYKKYEGYKGYEKYTPYDKYSSYTPYDKYAPPYTPYTPYTPYPSKYGYGPYTKYQTYNTTTTTAPAKPGFPFGGGRQKPLKKKFGYGIKTFGILELHKEFNKKRIKPLISDFKRDKFNIL